MSARQTFSKTVKDELATIVDDKKAQLAELSGLIKMNAELNINDKELVFKTTSLVVARRYLSLMKKLYDIKDSTLATLDINLRKNKQFIVGIKDDIEKILSEHDLFGTDGDINLLVNDPNTYQAYLRGIFLASGSVNDPKTSAYHLEIFCLSSNLTIYNQSIINEFGLNAKITKRRNGYITYLKNVESIVDFLRIIKASNSAFLFDDIKIKREIASSINRVINIELANEKKALNKANQQIKDIKIVQRYYQNIDPKLSKVMKLRLEFEQHTLKELTEEYNKIYKEKITKSGLNHRFIRIAQLALAIKNAKK